jgi:hypothetical protein
MAGARESWEGNWEPSRRACRIVAPFLDAIVRSDIE